MSVILGILAATLFAFAAFTYKVAPKAYGAATATLAVAVSFSFLAFGADPSIVFVALGLIATLTALLFWRNTVATQRVVAFSSVAVLAVGLLTGLGMAAFNSNQPNVVLSVAEGGNPASYPVTDTADTKQVEATTRLLSGQTDAASPIRYYAYEAEPGTNNMGPAIHLNTAQDGLNRVGEKMTKDPLYAATLVEFRQHGASMNQEAAHRRAQGYVKNRQAQMNDAQALLAQIDSAYLADFGATRYESLGMIPGSNSQEMPTLTKFSSQPAMEQTLVVKFKDGRGMYLRVACDLQPSVFEGFKGVPTPPTPERPPSVPPTPYVPPTGGVPPPSTTQVPPTSGTPTPSTSTSTTKTTTKTTETTTTGTTTTGTTTTKTTTTPSTTVPTTSTTPSCPPEHPDCKDPDGGPPTTDGQTPNPAPSGEPETTVPVEPNPIDPGVPTDAPAPGVGAPSATNVPTAPRPTEELPAPVEPAPEPSNPGTGSSDPDAQSAPAPQMGAASAPAAIAPAPAPIQQPAPVAPAPVAEPQALAPVAPVQQQPASAPAETAESAPPAITVTEVEPMSFSQQSSYTKGGLLVLLLIISTFVVGSLVRKH